MAAPETTRGSEPRPAEVRPLERRPSPPPGHGKPAPPRKLTKQKGSFEGDVAIKDLRERMARAPDLLPEPPMCDGGGSAFGMVGRLVILVTMAAIAAYGFVWTSTAHDGDRGFTLAPFGNPVADEGSGAVPALTGFLSTGQEDALKAYVGATLPRSTRQVGAWIEQEFGLVYESRSAFVVYPDSSKTREKFLVFFGLADSARRMIRGGFLTEEDRGKLVALFGRWIELSGSRRCVGARWLGGVAGDSAGQRLGAVDGRRHDPWLAQTV
jgi:hypothetical protein